MVMKTPLVCALSCALTLAARAAINIPGATGFDGDLNITADTVIDLSQAVPGTWNDPNQNPANAGKGVYDPAKWAVVFKYSSVNVAAGATVTFKNHTSRAPVVWLVNGNVTINGTVCLNGQDHQAPPILAEPGPGGFRGGTGWYAGTVSQSAGFGIGGGSVRSDWSGSGGSYGTLGPTGSSTYGNPAILPLLGGSGGAGNTDDRGPGSYRSGGGGGGAMLIACTSILSVSGEVTANGGRGLNSSSGRASGSGSGGGIRLLTSTLAGTGKLNAVGGSSWIPGGSGRIRIERVTNSNTITVTPDPSVVPLSSGDTALIFPPFGAPEVKIVSIGGQDAPDDPKAAFGTEGADVALPQTTSTTVVIRTTNVEKAATVKVRGTPRSSGNFTEVTLDGAANPAVRQIIQDSPLPLVIDWTATLPVQVGSSAVQVRVIRP